MGQRQSILYYKKILVGIVSFKFIYFISLPPYLLMYTVFLTFRHSQQQRHDL